MWYVKGSLFIPLFFSSLAEQTTVEADLSDKRFQELLYSSDFALDPTRLKKATPTMQKIQQERARLQDKPQPKNNDVKVEGSQSFKDPSIAALVSSVPYYYPVSLLLCCYIYFITIFVRVSVLFLGKKKGRAKAEASPKQSSRLKTTEQQARAGYGQTKAARQPQTEAAHPEEVPLTRRCALLGFLFVFCRIMHNIFFRELWKNAKNFLFYKEFCFLLLFGREWINGHRLLEKCKPAAAFTII